MQNILKLENREIIINILLMIGIFIIFIAALMERKPKPNLQTFITASNSSNNLLEAKEYKETQSIKPIVSGRINLNTATKEQLQTLPKIGEKTADKIIKARPIKSLEDFEKINGIGVNTVERLKPFITF